MIWLVGLGLITVAVATSRRTRTASDYLYDGRRHGSILTAVGIAGSFIGGGTLLALFDRINQQGLPATSYLIGVLLALILLAGIAHRWRHERAASLADVIEERFGADLGRFSRGICLVGVLGLLAVQLGATATVLQITAGLSPAVAAAAILAIIVGTTLLGGLRFDAWSDALQYILIVIALALALAFVPLPEVDAHLSLAPTLRHGSWSSLGAILLVPAVVLTNPVIFHRLQGSSDRRAARGGTLLATALYLLMACLLILLALRWPPHDALSMVLLDSGRSGIVAQIFAAGVLAAVASSMDTHLLCIGGLLTRSESSTPARLVGLGAAALAFGTWWLVGDLFEVMSGAWLILLAGLLGPCLALFQRRPPKPGAILSGAIVATAVAVLLLVIGWPRELAAVIAVCCASAPNLHAWSTRSGDRNRHQPRPTESLP